MASYTKKIQQLQSSMRNFDRTWGPDHPLKQELRAEAFRVIDRIKARIACEQEAEAKGEPNQSNGTLSETGERAKVERQITELEDLLGGMTMN